MFFGTVNIKIITVLCTVTAEILLVLQQKNYICNKVFVSPINVRVHHSKYYSRTSLLGKYVIHSCTTLHRLIQDKVII